MKMCNKDPLATDTDIAVRASRCSSCTLPCKTRATNFSAFEVAPPQVPPSALDTQVGGDHYKKLGDYQPWEVLRHWLTPEEFRGYMKGTAIAYLARERDKGGMQDIAKAAHTLTGLTELGDAS